jgi:hypothetical protein
MKRFVLPLTTAVSAAILSSCSANEWQITGNARVCVDDAGVRVVDSRCADANNLHHHWYYISHGGYVPRTGGHASGGSFQPSAGGGSYSSVPESAPAGSVTRGGFGASAGGHSGGGEGAGE